VTPSVHTIDGVTLTRRRLCDDVFVMNGTPSRLTSHTRTHAHTRTHTHMYTCTRTRTHTRTHAHTRTHTHMYTCTHAHAHAHTRTRTHTHAHAHAYRQPRVAIARCILGCTVVSHDIPRSAAIFFSHTVLFRCTRMPPQQPHCYHFTCSIPTNPPMQ
jgi:hypothetical protein